MLFTLTTVAQSNSINYKALIKDASNAVVANTQVTVQFRVLQGVAQANVYQETHTPTTDANGIIIINIGDGVVNSGVYANIDWSSDDHFLNTQIDSGSGLTNMGTTGFNAVPYALSAKTAETASNVTGLETINEGNGNGLVKVGRVAANYGSIGLNAVDLTYSSGASTTLGATGLYSAATGFQTTAIGDYSTAMGWLTEASGDYSTAMGRTNTASGHFSTAMGISNQASGIRSTAMGAGSTASGDNSMALGHLAIAESWGQTTLGNYNVATTAQNTTAFDPLDRLLVVGNGVFNSHSDALVILKNGTITAPSFGIAEITDAKALVTKEFADANYIDAVFSGDYNDLTNAPDTPLSFNTTSNTGIESTTNTAIGDYSIAMGWLTEASGDYSTAMGRQTIASGLFSTAIGIGTTASGTRSTAMGAGSTASGDNSMALGHLAIAESWGQTTLGNYNVATTAQNTTAFDPLDRLLVVGNGVFNSHSDALVILKNGTITAPSLGISEITDAKALVTKEFADANYIDAGFSGDYNDLTNTPDTPFTFNTTSNTGIESASNTASGVGATAFGSSNTASGDYSTAMGRTNTASGHFSTAIGQGTTASGTRSTAMGAGSTASGDNSMALGSLAIAESWGQTTLGNYNVATTPLNTTAFDPLDRLLVVGNGYYLAHSDALVILKNGNATLAGSLTQNSDRRLKTDIKDLNYGLNTILQLNPVSYYWKKHRDSQSHRSLGLIAQEVQPILKELISVGRDENKTLSLDYVSLVPVLIKGMQEQQAIIETQAKKIEALEKKEKLYASLEARLSALETAKTNEDEVAVATIETTKE